MLIPFNKENIRVGMLLVLDEEYYVYKIKEIIDDKTVDVVMFGTLENGILVERKIEIDAKNIHIGVFRKVYIPGARMK